MNRERQIVGFSYVADHATTISVVDAVGPDDPFQLPALAGAISQSLFAVAVELAWTDTNKLESVKRCHNRSHTGCVYQINSDGTGAVNKLKDRDCTTASSSVFVSIHEAAAPIAITRCLRKEHSQRTN